MATTELEQVIASSQKLSPRTRSLYLAGVREFITYAGTSRRNWTGTTVENWRDKLKKTGMKPQSINVKLNALRFASRRIADKAGDPKLDFAHFADLLKPTPPERPEPLSVEQARALVLACAGDKPIDIRDKAIAVLGLRTGLRRSAMCDLKIEDLKGRKLNAPIKGGRDVQIILDDETMVAIREWLTVLRSADITSGPLFRSVSRSSLDGTTNIGENLTTDGLYRALKARAKMAGVQNFYPHVLRHTFIFMAVAAGVPLHRIREMTGSKSEDLFKLYLADAKEESASVASHIPTFDQV
jgi:integrase